MGGTGTYSSNNYLHSSLDGAKTDEVRDPCRESGGEFCGCAVDCRLAIETLGACHWWVISEPGRARKAKKGKSDNSPFSGSDLINPENFESKKHQ